MRTIQANLCGLRVPFLAVILTCASGCGDNNLSTVQGEVTLDGKPVAGAMIVFQSETGGPPANAITDAAGRFRMSTFANGDGMVPGTYKVTVAKFGDAPAVTITADPSDRLAYLKQYDQAQKASRKAAPTKLLPDVYYDMMTTPLRQQVPPDGKLLLRLTSKGA